MPTERQRATEALGRNKQRLEDLVAMGLAEYAKWDVVIEREKPPGTVLSDAEIIKLSDSYTERQWEEIQQNARNLLTTFAKGDTKWAAPIIQGVIAAFIYSILLVVVLIIIKANNIDVLHALGIEQTISGPQKSPSKSDAANHEVD